MKRTISLMLTVFMLILCIPFSALNASAATYSSISLDVPWFCQRRYADCMIASIAMVEGYYIGCNDNDANVYNAVYSHNNYSVEVENYSKMGYSLISNSLEDIYNQLKNGNPVIVYRVNSTTSHASVIYGYNGSTTTLQKSGFLVRHTYKYDDNYTICSAGSLSWTNLEAWLSGWTWSQTIVRTSSKIDIDGSGSSGGSTAVTVTGSTESLKCPFDVYLPANTEVELYWSDNKTNYAGTINDSYGQWFESKWEIYLSDGSTEYYIYYGGNYYYMIAVDGVTAEITHSSTEWVTTKEPTCSATGTVAKICNTCGSTLLTMTESKTDHTPDSFWTITKEASCDATGTKVKYCSVCGEVTSTATISKTSHTFEEWFILTEPTTTSTGEKARYCTECLEPEYETIPVIENSGNLAFGADYTISGNGMTVDPYTADLTDGIAEDDVEYMSAWFAFKSMTNDANTVDGIGELIFDMGSRYDITDVRVHLGYNWDWGVTDPYEIKLYISDDGINYTEYSETFSITPAYSGDAYATWTELNNISGVSGRYVKLAIGVNGTWCWLNEVEIYGTEAQNSSTGGSNGGSSNNNDNYFQDSTMETGTEGLEYTLSSDGTYYIVSSYSGTEGNVIIPSVYNGLPVKEIGRGAFGSFKLSDSNTLITSVSIPNSITTIGNGAFANCRSIKEITIPYSVSVMGMEIFWHCYALTDIYCEAASEPEGWASVSKGDEVSWNGSYDAEWNIYAAENITIHWNCNGNSTENTVIGDVNGNGEIDARDYVTLKRAYFGTYKLDPAAEIAGDINGNGQIDARDYVLLKRAYFGTYSLI